MKINCQRLVQFARNLQLPHWKSGSVKRKWKNILSSRLSYKKIFISFQEIVSRFLTQYRDWHKRSFLASQLHRFIKVHLKTLWIQDDSPDTLHAFDGHTDDSYFLHWNWRGGENLIVMSCLP